MFGNFFTFTIALSYGTISGYLPISDFSYTPEDPIIYNHIEFKDNSSDTQSEIVSWLWDFDDGYYSDVQNPTHCFYTAGTYNVSLTVTNDTGFSDTVQKEVIVFDDNIPSTVEILGLDSWFIEFNFLYFTIRISGPTILFIGKVYVIVEAIDNVGVESVEFYIVDVYQDTDYEPPYIWVWDGQFMLCVYELKVVARDYAGNEAVDMRKVWRVSFLPPEP